ncbi:hypothetical protein DMH04_07770 [Kibdelosporangium aridum]|uniref:SH3 domain-containing protein n=1 Tax=Kibdelosporangium aridum TaxID=2030 RepID=A0A428ZKN6_KIBAR|nr:hypothetical protein [Kibdelosporangium aridum]RSM88531.1 hypothetical protein DMH04_07770 [Kibdelosporangium aridum]
MRIIRSLLLSGAAALTVFSGVLAAVPAGAHQTGDVGIQHYSCGSSRPPNYDEQGPPGPWPKAIRNLVAQSGSAFSCSDLGGIYHGDRLDYYCFTLGNDGQYWTYVSAFDRGIAGWVPDDSLAYPGSNASCLN